MNNVLSKYSPLALAGICSLTSFGQEALAQEKTAGPRKNVVFILSDDHRYDYMGFLGVMPFLQTPNMDFMASHGVYVQNAFVTTSLSSPSRASILTGLFSHEHGVVDNQAPLPEGLTFFPQYLQQAGYRTAFFGKWHMGNDTGAPQPGFDHWEGFQGQGTYYNARMNVNGTWVNYDPALYSSDIITDHAIDFIRESRDQPFFVYLSHKAVHLPFEASPEDRGRYADEELPLPPSFNDTAYDIPDLPSLDSLGKAMGAQDWYGEKMKPDWVKNQRESWHGVDYCYHGDASFREECLRYCETVTSLDRTIGRVLQYLKDNGLEENTVVIYMGDNGFLWGEQGLIDKRNFYEPSVRVPMLVYNPGLTRPGSVVKEMVQNIDIAPTVMDLCGMEKAPQMHGDSFVPLLKGEHPDSWRKRIYYEYYWEFDYPQTPTTFGVRTDRFKYIKYHGVWDTNEFYDLENDPDERYNLINDPRYQSIIKGLNSDLYDWLESTGGMNIPLKRTVKYHEGDHRNPQAY